MNFCLLLDIIRDALPENSNIYPTLNRINRLNYFQLYPSRKLYEFRIMNLVIKKKAPDFFPASTFMSDELQYNSRL